MSITKETPVQITNAIGASVWEGMALQMGKVQWVIATHAFTIPFLGCTLDATNSVFPKVTATGLTQVSLDYRVKLANVANGVIGYAGINLTAQAATKLMPMAGPGWIVPVKTAASTIVAGQPIGNANAGGLQQSIASVVTAVTTVLGTAMSPNVGDGTNFYNQCLVAPK